MNRTDERYWQNYDGLQVAKHKILEYYLAGWFPKLCSWQGRVLYIDCHAGRGRHKTGHHGSPILALNLLLKHSYLEKILSDTEINFFLFEKDETNYKYLCEEISKIENIPPSIKIKAFQADYQTQMNKVLDQLIKSGKKLAPSFAFVDPYGFSLSMEFLNKFLGFPASELLINFMFRYIDMAITHDEQDDNMDTLFGSSTWKTLRDIDDIVIRSEKAIKLFGKQLNAEYVTHMYMRSGNRSLKYALIHATNHRSGRELMKNTMWRIIPDGSFSANEKDSPNQPVLLIPEPNLSPLEEKLMKDFSGRTVNMNTLYDWLLKETYVEKHLHSVLRNLRNSKKILATDYGDRFAFKYNPIWHFPNDN